MTGSTYSPRIVGAKLPSDGLPIVITNYRIGINQRGIASIDLYGIKNPFVQSDFVLGERAVTPVMSQLLGVEPNLRYGQIVPDKPDSNEGLWNPFWGNYNYTEENALGLLDPFFHVSGLNIFLLGSTEEQEGLLKIPSVNYFVRPEPLTGPTSLHDYNFWETSLHAQEQDWYILPSRDVKSLRQFFSSRDYDSKSKSIPLSDEQFGQWIRSEVERFERNGQNLKEKQIADAYQQLRDFTRRYNVVTREILAVPLSSPKEDMIVVSKADHERYKSDSERLAEMRKSLGPS